MASSLYLHIPFCSTKCRYCSFVSAPGQHALFERYCRALELELATCREDTQAGQLDTLFFGGGTPSILGGTRLAGLLEKSLTRFSPSPEIEITLEANPGSLEAGDLAALVAAGVNRFSIGVQSMQTPELHILGRNHKPEDCERVVAALHRAGVANLSLDLMYGIPGQTPSSWFNSLQTALQWGPHHLSIYQLSVEPGTPFFELCSQNRLQLPEDEIVAEMDAITADLCRLQGMERYEISNYSLPGYRCRHNQVYWRNEPYLACGAGAVSYIGGVRRRRVTDPLRYCELVETGAEPVAESEKLDPSAQFRETVILGLRLIAGVDKQRVEARFGRSFSQVYGGLAKRLVGAGLLEETASHIRLTPLGLRYANTVMAELV